MQPEAESLLPWVFSASQYLGVFAGYVGVITVFTAALIGLVAVIMRPIMEFRERQAESRRYDFLEMFDDDRFGEVIGKARRAANEHLMHMRREGTPRGVSSADMDRVEAGLDAAITNLERQMNRARARRTKQEPNRKTTVGHMLEVHRKLMKRKRAVEAKEKSLGLEPAWEDKIW